MGCYQRQEQGLEQTQSLGLRQLLTLSQILRSPSFPNATRGLEGMIVADRILKQRKAIGVLIGGLATTIYQKKPLAKHKDVDVMVADESFELKEEFEGGIDWWLPHCDKIDIHDVAGYRENIAAKWWSNGNNVTLQFGIEVCDNNLEPGLQLPTQDWVKEMRLTEAISGVDARAEGVIDDEVEDAFREKFDKKFTLNRIRQDVWKALACTDSIATSQIAIHGTELDVIRGINRKLGNVRKAGEQ